MAAPATLRFAGQYVGSSSVHPVAVVADRVGNLFAISNVCAATTTACTPAFPWTIQIVRTDLAGNVRNTFRLGGSASSLASAAMIDKAGNLVIVGATTSADFPLVSPLQTAGGGFLTKIDSQLQGIVYSTRFAGLGINTLTSDAAGNIYFAGTTAHADLPVTSGAFQTQGSVALSAASAYLAEISASGRQLLFATYYSGTRETMYAGFVPLYPPMTNPTAVLIDDADNIVVAGNTSDTLPVTAGGYSQTLSDNTFVTVGFAAKFAPGGTSLLWATFLPYVSVNSALLDSANNLVTAGVATVGFATTADAIQPSFPQSDLGSIYAAGRSAGYVLKLASTGDKLIESTYFGGNTSVASSSPIQPGISQIASDDSGNVWITGSSAPLGLPANPSPELGQAYVAELSGDLKSLQAVSSLPDGSAGTSVAGVGGSTAAVIGSDNRLMVASQGGGPWLAGLTSSPQYFTATAVAPAELVSLYGVGIGPNVAQVAQAGTDGVIGTTLGGVQVLFHGVPAALLYAGPNQINAIVPAAVRGLAQTSVTIAGPNGQIDVGGLTVQDYAPTMFGDSSGFAAPAVNADGTINSASNPAVSGSVVAVWLTGAGSATGADNRINVAAPVTTSVPISVLTYPASQPLDIVYVGDAPEQPSGITQINFRLPATNNGLHGPYDSLNIQAGSATSATFYIYVR